jgi:hypothetical protein
VAACGPASTGTPGATASTSAPGASPTVAAKPEQRLATALGPLQRGYTFDTTITVDKQVAATVTGRRFGNSSELSITSNNLTVTYRVIPPSAWFRQETGDWVVAQEPGSTADPLAPLLTPTTVKAGAGAAGVDELDASYPPGTLGVKGTDPVAVIFLIAADGTVTVRYETTVALTAGGSKTGVSETILHPAPIQDPIAAPSPLASGG